MLYLPKRNKEVTKKCIFDITLKFTFIDVVVEVLNRKADI